LRLTKTKCTAKFVVSSLPWQTLQAHCILAQVVSGKQLYKPTPGARATTAAPKPIE